MDTREQRIESMFASLQNANMDTLLASYRKVEAKRKEYEAVVKELSAMEARLETMMNDLLMSRGEDGAVTEHGKVQRKVTDTYYAADKIVFRDWAIENNLPELVNTTLAVRAFNAYMTQLQVEKQAAGDETPVDLPPGVGIKQTIKLSITK